jgi:5-formyltetrahydrofolate cyclo-ligase
MSKSKIIRQQIWRRLLDVAKPDTRFHLNFSEVIPDFDGSEAATAKVVAMPEYAACTFAFITPDNCLVDLRRDMIAAGKSFVMSTYGIYRGFLLMEAGMVPSGAELYAAWLDGMEHFARPISLAEIAGRGRFDFMATGASAVSVDGVRFGKGHGFFDLEWGMFTDLGLVD